MCLVTERTLEAASKHANAREGIIKAADFIGGLSSVVKPMLEANAVASMAVSAHVPKRCTRGPISRFCNVLGDLETDTFDQWAGICVLSPVSLNFSLAEFRFSDWNA